MKGYYEHNREQDAQLCVFRNHQHCFLPHFHNNVEIYVLEEGEQQVVCNGKTYDMQSGSIAFFDSYDVHGYLHSKAPCKSSCVLIIPFPLLANFRSFRKKAKVATPVVADRVLAGKLLAIIDGVLAKEEDEHVTAAAVDMVLAFLEQKLEYAIEGQAEDVALVKKILEYIYEHFKEDVRLSTIATKLGYTEEHLSREFHKFLHQSIPSYVNRLRLDYVELELRKGEKKLSQIIYEAGFNNFQTYYRNKKKNARQ